MAASGSERRGARERTPGATTSPTASGEEFAAAVMARLDARREAFRRYEVEDEIGRGGMGTVLRVRDEDLHRELAMKVLRPDSALPTGNAVSPVQPRRLARFLEEAQVTGQLDHPGIVPVHELGLDPEGRVYFTMKLVRGSTFTEVLEYVREHRDGWTTTRSLSVLLRVCEAMSYAHAHSVIHRDLKPSNVMVGRFGETYVMDWGLARILDRPDSRDLRVREPGVSPSTQVLSDRHESSPSSPSSPLYTMDGEVLGTPVYMSPEQALGLAGHVGPPSDVYAVGAMLYHLLAGHMPYVGAGAKLDAYLVWRLVREGPPAKLERIATKAPAELIAICEKAMERDLARRYRTMQELGDDLRAYLEGRVVQAHRTGPLEELKKWAGRNRSMASLLALLVLVVGTSGFVVAWQERTRSREVERNHAQARAGELLAEADRLWPVHPDVAPSMNAWLVEAERLVQRRDAIESELADLVDAAKRAGRVREGNAVTEDLPSLLQELASEEFTLTGFEGLLERAPAVVASGVLEAPGDPTKTPLSPEEAREIVLILPREVDDMRIRVAELRARAAPRASHVFEDRVEQKRADRLAEFLARIDTLTRQTIPGVRARAERARGLFAETVESKRTAWDEAIRTIADRSRCPDYEGLRLTPQVGLVPLGLNPQTRLFEFWHVLTGDEPERDPDGTWRVGPTSGLVLVLIPAATTVLGCQARDAAALHFDPAAQSTEEPSAPIELAPFFFSKFEMTQGQWIEVDGANPSTYWSGVSYIPDPRVSRVHPVESVSWTECHAVFGRVGLAFPTEAQWEYAARARSDQPFGEFDRFGELASRFNWADYNWDRFSDRLAEDKCDIRDDGFRFHASIGSFEPNGFGLFDVFGNVSEWCRDWYKDSCTSARVLPGSGERVPDLSTSKTLRGGSYRQKEEAQRVARRFQLKPIERGDDLGVRPVRALDP